jgi:diadenosine tetraphosphatase ApaH/serine/threonine PP2A family protein phosphatase
MRIAVISDVHGNLNALESVLEEIAGERVDAIWCLGDIVGYGARPNECCATVEERAHVCLAGNHDLLALRRVVFPGDFNPDAAVSGQWTAATLDASAREFLAGLEPEAHDAIADLYHASARDPVWEYVLSEEAARATLSLARRPLVLVGHSHVPLALELDGGTLAGGHAPAGMEVSLAGERWLLNPGSVGQPRDGDPRAAWLLLDVGDGRASFRRVAYDLSATQDEIRAAGLPASLAERLALGL